jgi:hypothetical protein
MNDGRQKSVKSTYSTSAAWYVHLITLEIRAKNDKKPREEWVAGGFPGMVLTQALMHALLQPTPVDFMTCKQSECRAWVQEHMPILDNVLVEGVERKHSGLRYLRRTPHAYVLAYQELVEFPSRNHKNYGTQFELTWSISWKKSVLRQFTNN